MQLVGLSVHLQLLPNVSDEEHGILAAAGIEGIAEPETILLKREELQALLVEIGIELAVLTCEAALVQIAPQRLQHRHHPHIAEMIVEHQLQVFVHREDGHRMKVGQHIIGHFILLLTRKGMIVELLHHRLIEQLHRHQHHIGVDQHTNPRRTLQQQVAGLEGLAKVGSHRYAALHYKRLIYNIIAAVALGEHRYGVAPDAHSQSLLVVTHF